LARNGKKGISKLLADPNDSRDLAAYPARMTLPKRAALKRDVVWIAVQQV